MLIYSSPHGLVSSSEVLCRLSLLVNEQRAERATYQELVLIRYAARRLLDIVDTSLHALIQKERWDGSRSATQLSSFPSPLPDHQVCSCRHAARRDLADASWQRRVVEQQASICGRLYGELELLKAQQAATSVQLVGCVQCTVCTLSCEADFQFCF